jgi:acyl-CoA synthetase (AMP-forming)/AMP-acid ligase II
VDKRSQCHEGTHASIFGWINLTSWILQGYLNNAAATKDSITKDGWFKTGDIAVRDPEGYYYIVDRRKELIKYKVGTADPFISICVLVR